MAKRRTTGITRKDTQAALSATGTRQYELGDERCPGLTLRVRARSAVWSLRGRLGPRQSTWRIADVSAVPDPDEARRRATEAKLMLARGIDPADWLQRQDLGGEIERAFDPEIDGWTWEQAREAFLAFVKQERRPSTHTDYRKTLNSADLDRWAGRLVKSITRDDVSALQDAIYARGARVQATHTLRVVKACLAWVADRGGSGIDQSPALAVRPLALAKRTRSEQETRVPTAEEIGALPWLLDSARCAPAARLAAMLALLTVQRRETIVLAGQKEFDAARSVADGGVWRIPADHMKSHREHVIPLPPLAWRVVRLALALGRDDAPWLFPQLRLRRKGSDGNGHMSAKALNDAMEAAGSPIRPHACRRAFGTHGEVLLGNTRADTKAILDHAEGQSGDVTAEFYALHDGTGTKWPVMRRWEAWVLTQIAAQAPKGAEDGFPRFLRGV